MITAKFYIGANIRLTVDMLSTRLVQKKFSWLLLSSARLITHLTAFVRGYNEEKENDWFFFVVIAKSGFGRCKTYIKKDEKEKTTLLIDQAESQ